MNLPDAFNGTGREFPGGGGGGQTPVNRAVRTKKLFKNFTGTTVLDRIFFYFARTVPNRPNQHVGTIPIATIHAITG